MRGSMTSLFELLSPEKQEEYTKIMLKSFEDARKDQEKIIKEANGYRKDEEEEKGYDIANLNPRKNPYIGKLKKG